MVSLDGETIAVRGLSWMDREFGSDQLGEDRQGWDWWSLQLEDGRDLMLYRLRGREETPDFLRGTVISGTGEPRYLEPEGWEAEARGTWKSPRTGAEYPLVWEIRIPSENLVLRIRPDFEGQENVAGRAGLHYWEGSVEVQDGNGRRVGRGYQELTGYGSGSRPPI
jgi:predicted secreted hydrolase